MILIVEDNNEINSLIYEALTRKGYECKQAYSGTEALLLFNNEEIDLIILDLMLPGMSGEEVLKKIREKSNVIVVVISAKNELDTKIDLFEIGADDYITKPFEIKELEAKIGAWIRRSGISNVLEDKGVISVGELLIDRENYDIKIGDNSLTLTRQEYKILELLMLNTNKVYTKQEIYDYAWEDYYVGVDKTINVHISNIRNKIKKFTDTEYIETVWGIGFKGKI